jgi:hypothetical protein
MEPSSVKMINRATLEMARTHQGHASYKKISLSQSESSEKKETKERC